VAEAAFREQSIGFVVQKQPSWRPASTQENYNFNIEIPVFMTREPLARMTLFLRRNGFEIGMITFSSDKTGLGTRVALLYSVIRQ
jgi:hypothetical protein